MILALRRLRLVDLCKFQASLVYIVEFQVRKDYIERTWKKKNSFYCF